MTDTTPAPARPASSGTHPVVYLILYLPYGIANGYATVTLGWLLSHAGAAVEAIAAMAGMALLANTWKVLWSPIVDISLTARAWFLIGLAATLASFAALAVLPLDPHLMGTFNLVVLLSSIAASVTAIAVDRLMAFDVPDHLKGQAGGWSQAGNLGGTGLGGGAGLWLAQHSGHPWIAAAALSAVCALCVLPLLALHEPGRVGKGKGYAETLAETWRDVLSLVRTRIGLLACFLMLMPIGSGGLQQLWAAIAKDWAPAPTRWPWSAACCRGR